MAAAPPPAIEKTATIAKAGNAIKATVVHTKVVIAATPTATAISTATSKPASVMVVSPDRAPTSHYDENDNNADDDDDQYDGDDDSGAADEDTDIESAGDHEAASEAEGSLKQASNDGVILTPPPPPPPQIQSSIVEISSSESSAEPIIQISNNLGEPEYDFLSRQPSEYVEETYKVVNLKGPPSKYSAKTRTSEKRPAVASKKEDLHPTGLVTKLGGTVVKDGATTVHETSVFGTYISGKYAQVLQSTSHIFHNKPRIAPSPSLRILKTAAPSIPKNRFNLDPTPSYQDQDASLIDPINSNPSSSLSRTSRKPVQNGGSKNNRFRSRNSKETVDYNDDDYKSVESKKSRSRPGKKR